MFAKFFRAATLTGGSWSDFTDDFLFATDKVVSYEYTKRFTKTGSFTLTLPFVKAWLTQLMVNGMVYYDGDWLWIQGISYDGRTITLSGTDAKGLLGTRVSLFNFDEEAEPGTQGYDVVSGTTKECIRHYITNNVAVGLCQAGRELPITAFSGADGLADDSYMVRLEYLSNIVTSLCENAGIGYDVTGQLSGAGFRLTTIQGTDRSFSQDEVPRVIFSPNRRNVRSMSCEHGVENLHNVVYGVDSNETVGVTYRDGNGDTQLARRECTTSISEVTVSDPLFDKYALHQIKDNTASHSYTIEAAVSSGYDSVYFLGDIVSVQDIYTGNMVSYRITEAAKSYSSGQRTLSLAFGMPKQKPLEKIVSSFISGTLRRR